MSISQISHKRTLSSLIQDKYPGIIWKPTKATYEAIGVNQKRFGMILKGKTSPTLDEVQRIASHFQLNTKDLL